ncbi:MAG: hypothetical protein B6D36_00290 [Planctomycetes bacterium UTPLA1]|jgi:hypothetical protein|nr:MAG: hypothetical protein B6D36_00290 [Planctomycetes bacterium UTPLA1]
MKKLIRWFAKLPIGLVAAHSIMLGVVLSAAEWDGWITWGHEASIVMVVPIIVWALLQRACR